MFLRHLLLFLALISLFALTSCKKKLLGGRVKYQLEGTADLYNVQYIDADGNLISVDTAGNDWSTSFDGRRGDFLFVSASAHGDSVLLKARIFIDGREFRETEERGDTITATAKGYLELLF
jgi:hypothetical protein